MHVSIHPIVRVSRFSSALPRALPGRLRALQRVAMGKAESSTSVLWFRKGLRLHENPALLAACECKTMFPVFCMDPWFISSGRVGVNRINFLLESLRDLDASLQQRGSRLIVLRGDPREVLPRVLDAWDCQLLAFERDTEPYAVERDAAVSSAAAAKGIKVVSPVSHTLFAPEELIRANGGKAPKAMGAFEKLFAKMPKVHTVGDAPAALPAADAERLTRLPAEMFQNAGAVPSLADLGLELADTGPPPFRGGETEALKRLDEQLSDAKWVCEFEKPKGNPAAYKPPATTVLSPYLKFGCLSVRRFHERLLAVYASNHNKHTKPPVSLHAQLLWREFFYTVGFDTPNFHQMEGNPSIRQIPWDVNPEFQEAWEFGRTGFPWIDAIMNQLRQWGWMHHLARHSVACFLTRGDLYCHWEVGRDVFDKYLLDGDHFVNNANWQWLSASAFFYQYFRVYSPITFGKKYDKNGDFIRHFVPVLKDMPAKYIYEPWTAPMEVQRAAKCIIGKDYPKPIVDHAVVSKANMDRHKAAYAVGKGEDDPADHDDANTTQSPAKKRPAPTAAAKKQVKGQRRLSFEKAPAPK